MFCVDSSSYSHRQSSDDRDGSESCRCSSHQAVQRHRFRGTTPSLAVDTETCHVQVVSIDVRHCPWLCTFISTLGDRSFSVAAPRAWNSLPPAIRAASSLTNENISLSLKFSGPLVTNSLFPLNVITAILYV